MNAIDERVSRGNTAVANAAKRGQSQEDQLAEALADLRAWAGHIGVSFATATELARDLYIYDKVKARPDADAN